MSTRRDTTRRPGKRRRGTISRDEIVEAALTIVDTEGLDALSMPRLARQVGCGTMTLYGYFSNKEDLLDALVVRVFSEASVPAGGPGDWETPLMGWARGFRLTLLAHPVVRLLGRSEIKKTPRVLATLEQLLKALREGGFDDEGAARTLYLIIIYVFGFVQFEVPRVHDQAREAYVRDWRQSVAGVPPEYEALPELIDTLVTVADEAQFEWGLELLLRGLRPAT